MLKRFIRIIGGDPDRRDLQHYAEIAAEVNALESEYEALSDAALSAKTEEFRRKLTASLEGVDDPEERKAVEKATLDEIMVEAFAVVREASKRTLGLRHYDVQLIGGMALHDGKIAEMRTGEGKTLVATLPLYLNALTGRGVHLITVNDYLARRDARWMAPIYNLLGMSVGVLQIAARTENGKKAFLVDLEKSSPHEDQDQIRMVWRGEAYAADITYGTNSEFGFDYLRDNMTMRMEDRVQRGHYYAIVDEVDNVLIDEARTPLIISGPAQDEAEWYVRMAQVVRQLRPEDCEVSEKDRSVSLTEIGENHVEEILGLPLRDPERPEDVTLEQARLLGYLEQALRAQNLFKRNKDYLIQGRKVIIVDEFTGRMMPGRRWSDGLHQAVEAKEGVPVQNESVTYATVTIQNYFRMYEKLSGMTGTAVTESEEFFKIYKLNVLAIPTNLEYEASLPESGLVELETRDDEGYKYRYYAKKEGPSDVPIFWKRKDYPDIVYRTEEIKLRMISQEILHDHALGRPVLVGTTSVELSERVSNRLKAEPLRRLAQVILLRHSYLSKHSLLEEVRQVPELVFLNQPIESLDISAMRKFSRELEMPFNIEDRANLEALALILDLPEDVIPRLETSLRGGIPHEVLNARKHTEESRIIAGAGAFGAVTIATNMAGRGVDIKLGGELPEEVLSGVNRILRRNGIVDPFSMTMESRRQALQSLDPASFGIYADQVTAFFTYLEQMKQVKARGGLHVIGSERHEARRIDNQLRGRSARQGDPGSSRFYLSMEDSLMRLFGGSQADAMMQRMKIDDALPLESGLVGRIVEQAQTSVEGANFDVRKHLLEYDDVLNAQRESIYKQRDRIFTKQDLTEDVVSMLRDEVTRRVPEALKDDGGPWKLLSWLEQIQPTLVVDGSVYPSYTIRLLLNEALSLSEASDAAAVQKALLQVARRSLELEKDHLILSISTILGGLGERLDQQIDEKMEILEAFYDGLDVETEGPPRRPNELLNDLSEALHLNLKLSSEAMRDLGDDPRSSEDEVREQVQAAMTEQAITRSIGAVERRLNEGLVLDADLEVRHDWEAMESVILDATGRLLEQRIESYVGENGAIIHDLQMMLSRFTGQFTDRVLIELLLRLPQGTVTSFDRKTHQKVKMNTTRLTYVFYAASFLESLEPEQVAQEVLEHLEGAQRAIQRNWGNAELGRLGATTLGDLDQTTRQAIIERFEDDYDGRTPHGDNSIATLGNAVIAELPGEVRQMVSEEMGRRALSGVYRQLLLGVIGQLWVDYLTQMESLRISIGLEAYAQRDPLVQYKSQASELFQNLFSAMRLEMVSRMFTYRPRDLTTVQTAVSRPAELVSETSADGEASESEPEDANEIPVQEVVARGNEAPRSPQPVNGKGKRKRRRHK